MIRIFLDTNFLSQFVKETKNTKQGIIGNGKLASLLDMLYRGVDSGLLICPTSQFQTQEAMLAEGLLEKFICLQHELSQGLYFREWKEILVHQTADGLLRYLGRPESIDSNWCPFTQNPHNVIDPLTTNKMKADMVKFAQLMQTHSVPESSYDREYDAQKTSFLQNSFFHPIRQHQLLGSSTYSRSANSEFHTMLIREAKITKDELPKVDRFFDSSSVDSIPFIHIFCSIFASLRFHEKNRNYKGNEELDAVALACGIPYCQIVTTDINMKINVVDRLHFDQKYGVLIFTLRVGDIDALDRVLSDQLGTI